jgi:hypothetical protein
MASFLSDKSMSIKLLSIENKLFAGIQQKILSIRLYWCSNGACNKNIPLGSEIKISLYSVP